MINQMRVLITSLVIYPHLYETLVWRYKNFTNVSKVFQRWYDMNDRKPSTSRPKRVKMSTKEDESSSLFSKTVYLVCNKYRKNVKGSTDVPINCQTHTAEHTLRTVAEKFSECKMMGHIAHLDLIAREAHYHPIEGTTQGRMIVVRISKCKSIKNKKGGRLPLNICASMLMNHKRGKSWKSNNAEGKLPTIHARTKTWLL